MAGKHCVNNGSPMKVYRISSCPSDEIIGTIYTNECFVYVEKSSYYTDQIRFLTANGELSIGFLDQGGVFNQGASLHTYGSPNKDLLSITSYCFKLNNSLNVVSNSGVYKTTLSKGDYIYTTSSTAGETNPYNLKIIGYRKDVKLYQYDGFVTLNYAHGSMYNKNFCLSRA